jgi:hypothetical protein
MSWTHLRRLACVQFFLAAKTLQIWNGLLTISWNGNGNIIGGEFDLVTKTSNTVNRCWVAEMVFVYGTRISIIPVQKIPGTK